MKKLTIAILVTIALVTISTSCKKDPFDEKRNAAMNIILLMKKLVQLESFPFRKKYQKKDTSDVEYDGNWEKVLDIWLKGFQFKIESGNLKPDYSIKLDMSCTNVTPIYSKTITVKNFNNTKSGIEINMSQDSEYKTFMDKVFSKLKSENKLDFKVHGIVTDKQGSPISNAELKITIDNQLETKV